MAAQLHQAEVAALMASVAAHMVSHKDELTALDAELGDGDLGRTIERGFNAIAEALKGELPADVGRLLYQLGKAFANAAPSSFGALFSAALMKGGMTMKDKATISLADCAEATQVALDALIERGKSQLGNKTMLDAIAPALEAMRTALAQDAEINSAAFFRAAADGAQRGADETQHMQSQTGRASWQGERSIGKKDPGAQAVAMMFAAAAMHLEARGDTP